MTQACPHCGFEIDGRGMHKHIPACKKRSPEERKRFAGVGVHNLNRSKILAARNGRPKRHFRGEPQIESVRIDSDKRIKLIISLSYRQFLDILSEVSIDKVELE